MASGKTKERTTVRGTYPADVSKVIAGRNTPGQFQVGRPGDRKGQTHGPNSATGEDLGGRYRLPGSNIPAALAASDAGRNVNETHSAALKDAPDMTDKIPADIPYREGPKEATSRKTLTFEDEGVSRESKTSAPTLRP